MSISARDGEILRDEGFTELEVEAFAAAVDPAGKPQPMIDIGSPFWVHLRETRQALLTDLVRIMEEEDWPERIRTREATDEIIDGFYGPGRRWRDPFEWLKSEYKPRKKKDLII